MRLLAPAILALAVGLSALQHPAPDIAAEVRGFHAWTKVNPMPVQISYWVDLLCVNPSPAMAKRADTNPHRQKTITVWVNSAGRQAMLKGGKFPVGSAIVKEKRQGERGPVELSTVMVKRDKGFNPACGDWEFGVLDAPGKNVTSHGKIAICAECHREKAATDYVFRGYVPKG